MKLSRNVPYSMEYGGRISHQAFVTDGSRRQYGATKTHLYYYAHGQVGFSMAVTKLNTIVLGAPGLLQWTGGVVTYSFNPNDSTPYTNLQPIVNPYYTMDLEPDDYFGYSVESGIFQRNGSVLYVGGAPRSNLAGGKVLVFEPQTQELKALDIKAKLMGPQIGSYFGASLCCVDINEDGLDDLLVGAPTFVKSNGALPYDQGAVFVYITKESPSGLIFEESGYVYGSGADGARFGTTIADLGDINGDEFRDIAIGAPWEDNGAGAVYIYMGYANGLSKKNVQRIQSSTASGFGWSIAKGVDVDQNKCNDLAIGAFNSRTSYLYRCIPTIPIHTLIRVPKAVNLPHNVTTFIATFCVTAPPTNFRTDIKLKLIGSVKADPEENRALVIEDSTYSIIATPNSEVCDQRTIYVNETADLLKPMILTFEVEADELMKEDSTTFLIDAARLSDDSILKASFLVQLMRDCGDDLFCSPWLTMTLEALDNPYIPGSNQTFGVKLTVVNEEEPAYGLKVNISLPMHPKRIPADCSFQDLMMSCDFPQPFLRNEEIVWEIELEYNLNITEDIDLIVIAELSDIFKRNISHKTVDEMFINVTPEANFTVSGKSTPNASITILREKLAIAAGVSFKHYFEITNLGPSDWPALAVQIAIPEKTNLSTPIKGCEEANVGFECIWSIPAMVSFPVSIPLIMDLNVEGDFLKQNLTYNATTSIQFISKAGMKQTVFEVTTTLKLEPASIIWYIVVPCIFVGLLLLAIIVRILHKRGFFLRKKHKMLQREMENQPLQESVPDDDNDDDEHEILDTSAEF
ncbi:unnamed protein product [Arctia plantaginis]|uniref:Uncharacterized protein n=1 Tax=Arctia plantaginis TaxID=874455 RepID=A0A8S0YNX0_ARCPL|nr:unnamed protein product [Arctia plantaginis]